MKPEIAIAVQLGVLVFFSISVGIGLGRLVWRRPVIQNLPALPVRADQQCEVSVPMDDLRWISCYRGIQDGRLEIKLERFDRVKIRQVKADEGGWRDLCAASEAHHA